MMENRKTRPMPVARLLLTLVFVACAALSAYAEDGDYLNGYYIRNYDVDITVNEDNTLNITESILANFEAGAEKHGIIRRIPVVNTIERSDGSSYAYLAKIDGVTVNADVELSSDGADEVIRIGDSKDTVKGDVRYELSYKYRIGHDPLKDIDEFYYNIIGNTVDTNIMGVRFAVHFPKEFDASTLGFTHGKEGSTDYKGVKYRIEDNTVYGSFGRLGPYEGLTMRLELEDGYYVDNETTLEKVARIIMMLPALFMALFALVYRKKGVGAKPVETVEFYPPDGKNSLEVGFLYDRVLDRRDVSSLLVCLAKDGYLKIRTHPSDAGYDVVLMKEYDGGSEEERLFVEGLRSMAAPSEEGASVSSEELEGTFYKVADSIVMNFNPRRTAKKLSENIFSLRLFFFVAGCAVLFATMCGYVYRYTAKSTYTAAVGIMLAIVLVLTLPFMLGRRKSDGIGRGTVVFLLAVSLVMTAVAGGLVFRGMGNFLNVAKNSPEPVLLAVVGAFSGLVIICMAFRMHRYKPDYNVLLGRLRGFRNFLITAEKERLAVLTEENPEYCFDILPYAQVLGVSDKWMKKFDGIAVAKPEWYDAGGHEFGDTSELTGSVDAAVNIISHSLTAAGTGYSSGGSSDWGGDSGFSSASSSGGGSSGGGSGGGGVSSW